MTSKILIFILLNTLFQLLAQGQAAPGLLQTQQDKVLKERLEKDSSFLSPGKSPLRAEDIEGFQGLQYYPYDPRYAVIAHCERVAEPVTFRMVTTTDRRPEYRTFATLSFLLEGKTHQLTLYQPVDLSRQAGYEDYLFLPFLDGTSGRETYGGGRFMEIRMPLGDSLLLDFNTCYNPYCAYNHKYSCPVPPQENHLEIDIRAGELPYPKQ